MLKTKLLTLITAVVVGLAAFVGCEKDNGPVAAFSADPLSGNPPLEVQFTDESTGSPTSWEWSFGDGNTSTEQNPSHTYNNGGEYDITLIVSNEDGADTLTEPGYIVVGEEYKVLEIDDFTFQWKIRGVSLDVRLSAPTTGWVAVGFEPEGSQMQGANLIIGYVDGETAMMRDDYGVSETNHQADTDLGGSDDLSNVDGSEVSGTTLLTFTIPLNSGDQYDKTLQEGQTYKLIFAYGSADNFVSGHSVNFARQESLEL